MQHLHKKTIIKHFFIYFQPNPVARKKKYRLYSPTSLTNAYLMVKEKKMSVKKASRVFKVPDTTLRDRVLGKVDAETAVFGKAPVLDCYEEASLVAHFKTMASYGYGYSRQECVDIASDYATQLGKRTKDKPFTMKWMRGFLKRWPELKVLKPRGLEHVRAKTASKTVVDEYFQNLRVSLHQHGLEDKPHLIYNIDEKGISIDHKPPYVVADASYCPQSVTSGRGKTVTVLGGGSASGVALPPYFVFPGKRMRAELLEGGSPGASATVSETGWSNSTIFREYLETHFLKFVPGREDQKVLLLVDGHRSHVSVDLVRWAKEKGIIIFILPAHTSHILQPMDVACYGPLEKIYNNLCHKLMRESSAPITRYNVCSIACKAYLKALSPENIQSGFRRAGIYPLNADAVPNEYMKPAEIFVEQNESSQDSQETIKGGVFVQDLSSEFDHAVDYLKEKEKSLRKVKSGKKKTERNTMSKIVAGKELSANVQELMEDHENNQTDKRSSLKSQKPKKSAAKSKVSYQDTQNPGPSAINILPSDTDSDTDSQIDPADLCCKCNRFQPEELRKSTSLVFTKWAQCDNCGHWVHLIYCTPVRVIRRGDTFLCHHCEREQ